MATVKKANVPPTHPTVYVGLALAVMGLLVAMYAYTGTRVYDIVFAFIALAGALLALAGILVAAWGRSIMAARASRSRRAVIREDALSLAKPVAASDAPASSETLPTIATPPEKKRFSFPIPKRAKKEDKREGSPGAVFAFKRREPAAAPAESARAPPAADDPRSPGFAAALPAETASVSLVDRPTRATLRCPQCGNQFVAEGVRPFSATCPTCGFASTI